ncbi:MAG TPA: hypothetical protein VIF44_05340 [Candidatus Limnocylindrales bacterium]
MIGSLARLAAIGTAGAAYVLGVRPQLQHWGATDAEAAEPQPGDGLVPVPRFASTRAITIAAAPSAVWPWLAQLGEGRGGLYSYESLERLFGMGMVSTDDVMPELQDLAPGDTVRLAPVGGPDGLTMTVAMLDAPRLLILASGTRDDGGPGRGSDEGSEPLRSGDFFAGRPAASWALVLRDVDGATRLISRWRMAWSPSAAADLFNAALVEPLHFALDEKMLRGVRDRVERRAARPVEPLESAPPR